MARRLSWDAPSLTLTCAPAQNQTERCHPQESRPLTVREYARIQTFPDEWRFAGAMSMQYKQIGNAVPVNLAEAVGRSIIDALNHIERYAPHLQRSLNGDSRQQLESRKMRVRPMSQMLLAVERKKARMASSQEVKGLTGAVYSAGHKRSAAKKLVKVASKKRAKPGVRRSVKSKR